MDDGATSPSGVTFQVGGGLVGGVDLGGEPTSDEERIALLQLQLEGERRRRQEEQLRREEVERQLAVLSMLKETQDTNLSSAPRDARASPTLDAANLMSNENKTWTLVAWLASTGIAGALAQVLQRDRASGQSEFEFVKAIGAAQTGKLGVLALLNKVGALDALADELWHAIGHLNAASAATGGAELQVEQAADADITALLRKVGTAPSPEMAALAALDDELLKVLEQGDIRLVRSLWLLKQADDFHIRRRQDLEAQDGGEDSPLMRPEEAVRLVQRGRRAAGVLSYGWPSPGDPDPTRHRIQAVRRALAEHTFIEGFFWE